jgi:hypothetical protein
MCRAARCALLAAATMWEIACAPQGLRRINLPTGPGTPAPDYAVAFAKAVIRCHDTRTFSAELSLSGHAGSQKLRGRVLVGLAPGALRLEALAPGGSPIFLVVADGDQGRLLLARDHRVLDAAAPADILDALVGVALGPDDLRALLGGCVRASAMPTAGRAYGAEWIAVDLAGGDVIYLGRASDGTWKIVAGSHAGLMVQYGELAAGVPSEIRLTRAAASGHPALDLTIGVRQVEVNGDLPRDRLVALTVPPGTSPITLQELRESYHR